MRSIAVPRRKLTTPFVLAALVATAIAIFTVKGFAAPAVTDSGAAPSAIPAAWKNSLDPLQAGGWAFISDGPLENPSAVYASTHNMMHNGNVVTAWVRWEFSRPQAEVYPLRYQSAVTREELDCDARSYRRSAVFYYRRNNLQEKELAFTALDDDTNWKPAVPGSEADAMLAWGCKSPAAAHHTEAADAPATAASAIKTKGKSATKTNAKAGAATSESSAPAPSSAPNPLNGGALDLHTVR